MQTCWGGQKWPRKAIAKYSQAPNEMTLVDQANFLTALSIAPLAFAKSSGIMTG
jgi:hypothetical protein